MKAPLLIVTTTLSDEDDPGGLARTLIERRLAACVQLLPVESVYRWEGKVDLEREIRLEIKTSLDRKDELLAFLEDEHPYEVAEIVIQPADTSADYGRWVAEETTP